MYKTENQQIDAAASIIRPIILKQFRVMDVMAVSPMRENEYNSVRRGFRWVMTRAGFGYVPEQLYHKALLSMGLDLDNLMLNKQFKPKDIYPTENTAEWTL